MNASAIPPSPQNPSPLRSSWEDVRGACFERNTSTTARLLNAAALNPNVDHIPLWAYAAEHAMVPDDWEEVDLERWAFVPNLWIERRPTNQRHWHQTMTPRQDPPMDPLAPVTALTWHEAVACCNAMSRALGARIMPNNGARTLVFDHGGSTGPGHAWMLERYPGHRLLTRREWTTLLRNDPAQYGVQTPQETLAERLWEPNLLIQGSTPARFERVQPSTRQDNVSIRLCRAARLKR